jgi:ribosome-binding factor A
MDPRRSARVAGTLRDELEEIANYELDDPRISGVTVDEVILSPDGKRALARVTSAGDANGQKATIESLNRAAGFVRRLLAERLDVYRVPEVSFEPALALESVEKAGHLLRRVRRGRPRE